MPRDLTMPWISLLFASSFCFMQDAVQIRKRGGSMLACCFMPSLEGSLLVRRQPVPAKEKALGETRLHPDSSHAAQTKSYQVKRLRVLSTSSL